MQKEELQTYHFIDGNFEMDINVSIEERTIYMNQSEIAKLLNRSRNLISRRLKEFIDKNTSICSQYVQKVNISSSKCSLYYRLEIIKEIGEKYNKERIEKLEKWLEEIIIENTQEVMDENFEIVRYNQDNLNIPIRINRNSKEIWLTQKEIADLFGTTKQNVNFHINNIFDDKELKKERIVKNYLTIGANGVSYNTTLYNLDMILAVGFRVRTSKAIAFRRWASDIIERFLNDEYNALQTSSFVLEKSQINLNNEVSEIKKEVFELKERVDEVAPKSRLFHRGEAFDAYRYIACLLSTAKKEIIYFDGYADMFTIGVMRLIRNGVSIIIITCNKNRINDAELELFHRDHPQSQIKVVEVNNEHDRQIIIDRKTMYSLGSSLNSLGYYDFNILEVVDKQIIKKNIEECDRYCNTIK